MLSQSAPNKHSHHRLAAVLTLMALLVPALPVAAAEYYVSPSGDDSGAGSLSAPFRTVGRALAAAAPGDTCILRAGTYREEATFNRPGVTLTAYGDEYVLLTGCDEVHGPWTEVQNPANGARFLQTPLESPAFAVFVDGRSMPLARWPDKTAHLLSLMDWAETKIYATTKKISIPELPKHPAGFWKGGVYIGLHTDNPTGVLASWFTIGGRIADSDSDQLSVTDTTFGFGGAKGRGAGFGYIIGAYNALDHDGEWHWGDGRLSLAIPRPQGGTKVEAQTRRFILTIAEPNITISKLNFRAGTLLVNGDGTKITGCTFRDISPFQHIADPSGASNWGAPSMGAGGVYVMFRVGKHCPSPVFRQYRRDPISRFPTKKWQYFFTDVSGTDARVAIRLQRETRTTGARSSRGIAAATGVLREHCAKKDGEPFAATTTGLAVG